MAWVVNAAAAVVRAGGADRYMYRGATLPDGVENIEHLAAVGLITEKPDQEPEKPDQEPEKPDQEPEKPDQEPEKPSTRTARK